MRQIKIKLRESDETKDVISRILEMRGVKPEDLVHYFFPDEALRPTYHDLDNIGKAVELLRKHVDNKSKIYIQIDVDTDGMTSASIMYQFLVEDLGVDEDLVSYHIPKTKVHGITLEEVYKHKPDLVIAPDASSSEFDIHKELKDKGIDVLVLDHHEVEENRYSEDAVVVNNQLSRGFENKGLTGANIVLLFCEAYCEINNLDIHTDKYLDLATVGMIADRASLLDTGVFYFVQFGLRNINNPLLRKILEKSSSVNLDDKLTTKDIEFSIAPMINALTRDNKDDDLDIVVDAIFGRDYEVTNKRVGITHVVDEAIRKMNNARSRQNRKVQEALVLIKERIEEKGLLDNKVLFINSTDILDKTGLNGLVAIKLAEEYKRPTLVLGMKDDGVLKGSARNFDGSPIEDFKELLNSSGAFKYALGHAQAFGVGLDRSNAKHAVDTLNDTLKDVVYDTTYYADLIYEGKPNPQEIHTIAKHKYMWGNGIEAPVAYIKNVRIKKSDIRFIGKNKDTLKINLGTCDGIKFKLTEAEKASLVSSEEEYVILDIVGGCSINSYKGMNQPQINILEWNVVGYDSGEEGSSFNVTDLPF